jgi:hypothetical protein
MIAALFARLAPYKLLFEIVVIGSIAAGVLYEVHQFLEHERDIGRKEVQARWDAQQAADQASARAKEAAFTQQIQEASQHANDREQTIRSLAAASGAASVGLRDTLATIGRSVPGTTVDALGKSVATLTTVLAECSGRYQAVATAADRHSSDVITLQEAWPKGAPK